jgi:hypothetical protein
MNIFSITPADLISLQFRHWTSDFRRQTFLYGKLTLAVFLNLFIISVSVFRVRFLSTVFCLLLLPNLQITLSPHYSFCNLWPFPPPV